MIHPEALAFTLAQTLVNPVIEYSEATLYPLFRGEYQLLKIKYPADEGYNLALQHFKEDKLAYIKKHTGVLPFDIAVYLSDAIFQTFQTLGTEGGTYYEHDQVRELMAAYDNGFDVAYRYSYNRGTGDFGEVEIAAIASKGKHKKEIIFRLGYLKHELETAAAVTALQKLLTGIKNEPPAYNTDTVAPPVPELALQVKSLQQKLYWTGGKEVLKRILLKLSRHFIDGERRIIHATPGEINVLIDRNFVFSRNADGSVLSDATSERLIYYGEISALVRLLYYLSRKKANSGSLLLFSTDADIRMFVHLNFRWYDKEDGNIKPIELKTLSDTWSRVERDCEKDVNKLLQKEDSPHRQKSSLIHVIKAEFGGI